MQQQYKESGGWLNLQEISSGLLQEQGYDFYYVTQQQLLSPSSEMALAQKKYEALIYISYIFALERK